MAIHRFIRTFPDALHPALVEALAEKARTADQRLDWHWRSCDLAGVGDYLLPIKMSLRPLVAEYKAALPHVAAASLLEAPTLLRYRRGDHFHEHADAWNTGTATRQVSIVCYLSDVDAGGATVFPKLGITVPPRRGSVLMFPSAWPFAHVAMPVLSGEKIVLVTWLHWPGPVAYSASPIDED